MWPVIAKLAREEMDVAVAKGEWEGRRGQPKRDSEGATPWGSRPQADHSPPRTALGVLTGSRCKMLLTVAGASPQERLCV